jgi:carbonic anhydrase/acetyltransferase-like protein (isoleucine patch superfamily)
VRKIFLSQFQLFLCLSVRYPTLASCRASIYTQNMLRLHRGRRPAVPVTSYVDISAQVLGDVTLGSNSSIWMNAVVRGDVNSITIGDNSNVQDCAVVHGMKDLHSVKIGNGVTIGHNACVHGCTIEDDVLIGIGAVVLNGAIIGAGSIIAAGALVPERTVVPPRSLVTGIPGKILRETTDADLEAIHKYATNYVEYTREYLAETSESSARSDMRSMSFVRSRTSIRE